MDARSLTADLSVASQIHPDDLAHIAEEGFRSVICNRPDGEAADQPPVAEIEAAASRVGLTLRHLPVVGGQMPETAPEDFANLLATLPRPILAYCRTGTRSAMLWALAAASDRPASDILATAREAGCDLTGLAPQIEARSRRGVSVSS